MFFDFKLLGVQYSYLIVNLDDYVLPVHEYDEDDDDLFLLSEVEWFYLQYLNRFLFSDYFCDYFKVYGGN